MLFDLRPKESLKDLFDRREEYAELSRLVDSGSWVVVLGKRMTGKTSLIKTFARENRGVYVSLIGAGGIDGFVKRLAGEAGFRLESVGIDLKLAQLKWSRAAEDIFLRLGDRVLVLDEAQDVTSPHFLKLLKFVWDSYSGIRIVFSGSYVGVMKRLLEPTPTSPLYGRKPAKLTLQTFTREVSKEFLIAGFRQYKVKVGDDEVEEAVDALNGYPGWLTYYGNFRCVRGLPHKEALKETVREGSMVIREELKNFLRARRKELYVKVLRMAVVGARWGEMKGELNINSKVLNDVVKTLTAAMLLEEKKGYYQITDPVLREAVRGLR